MVLSFYAAVSLAAFLGASVHIVELSPVTTPSLPTTMEPTVGDVDSDNGTEINATLYQTNRFMYFNFARIGYHIFLKKMLEALRIFNFFMKMDPMYVKLTRTYLFLNTTGDNTTDLQSNDTGTGTGTMENSDDLETNTEAPPHYQSVNEPSESDTKLPDSEPVSQNLSEENEKLTKQDDVKQSKVQPDGFFGKVANVVTSVFHTLTNWF